MAVDQERVSKVLSILSHPLRRRILFVLNKEGEYSFTDLMNELKIDTGKLSFHLRALSAFLEQTKNGRYKLNRIGENAVRAIGDLEFWADVSVVDVKPTQLPLASFGKRALAFLLDLSLVLIIMVVLMFPTVISIVTEKGLSEVGSFLFFTLGFLWVYSALLEGFNGQTLGKRMLALKVVRIDGKALSYEHAAVRNFGKAFLLPFDLAAGLKNKDPRVKRYFDKFSGTTVIDMKMKQSVPSPEV
jgi:uncharacterized RDD family membrane protein YckC/DNA-binding transcriptional ArsR family regulator